MPKLRDNQLPMYRLHKQSGQAVVTLNGRDLLLGTHGSATSRSAYHRLTAEWLANGRRLSIPEQIDRTVNEVIAAFWDHASNYYRRADGSATSELGLYRHAIKIVRQLYGAMPADSFSPNALRAVRQVMLDKGWNRTSINQGVKRVRRMFKWAVGRELVSTSVLIGLQAVESLKAGRCDAPEPEPVTPAPEHDVVAVRPHVSRQVRAMIDLQLLTGMRPGEVCAMRMADLDVSGRLWLYKPLAHKTAHHGHDRLIYVGPRGQEILRPFLKSDMAAHLFSPAEAESERRQVKHAARSTPMRYGNSPGTNRKRLPKKTPGHAYTTNSYRRAIANGCKAAGVPTWNPHRLRHNAATSLRRQYGLEAAQVILGHKTLTVTQIYAERNIAAAAKIMTEVG